MDESQPHTHTPRDPPAHLEQAHPGSTGQAHNYSHANKAHFSDIEAEKMDEHADANTIGNLVADAMLGAYPFSEDETVVMDFACGTGIISRKLASRTRRIVGVDISEAMVKRYNLRADRQGIKPEEMHAECLDLEESPAKLNGELFDVIVCAASYHHFASIEPITRTLVSFLKPGGALLVADMAQNAANTEIVAQPYANIVAHRSGFAPAEIEAAFTAAGLVDVAFDDRAVPNVKTHGREVNIFLAKGIKPLGGKSV